MDGKPISTIGRERRTNRALSLDVEAFVDYQLSSPPPLPADFKHIKQANLAFDSHPQGVSDLNQGGGAEELES